MVQKRRIITGDTTKYPMILEDVLYEQLKDSAKSLKVSVAVVIQEALKQYLVGDAKNKEVERLTRENKLLVLQLKNYDKTESLAEAIRQRTFLEQKLNEATEKLSEIEGFFNQ